MKYSFDGYNYLIRLDKGEKLTESLERFAAETKIEGAWVSGLGAALEATLGYYDLEKKEYVWRQFEGVREIVSLTGNLAYDEDGTFIFHLHGVLSDEQYQTVGGHVKDLTAGGTLELFIHRAYQPTRRKLDENTGLKTLDL
ncbi:DNA-binding protein [Candidatus Saccharibacteria bacterium]|nr:DNA-binding protein [Candidatus Saccharibacteria bacterium]